MKNRSLLKTPIHVKIMALAIAVTTAGISQFTQAATDTWSGATDGAWNTTTSNWLDDGTDTLFNSGNDVLFTGTPTNNVTAATGLTIGAITLDNTFTGSVTLTGNNTVNGATTLSGGTLIVTLPGTATGAVTTTDLGTSAITVNSGGTFSVDDTGNGTTAAERILSLGNTILGSGTMNAKASALMTNGWSSINFTGDLSGFTGTLNVVTPSTANRAKVKFTNGNTQAKVLSSSATVNVQNGAQLYLTEAVNYGFAIKLNGGTGGEGNGSLRLENASLNVTGPITLQATSAITTSANATIGGAIGESGGSFGLTKQGGSTLTLNNVNSYSGATTISAGTLRIGAAGSLGSGTYAGNISNAGTLQYSSSASQTLSGIISGAGALIKDTSSTSTLTLSGSNSYTGATSVSAGILTVSGSLVGTANNAGQINVGQSGNTANATLNIQPGATITQNGSTSILIGNGTSTANGNGAVYQSGGTVSGVNQLQIGAGTGGSYGYYNLSGGTISLKELDISGGSALGNIANGVLDMTSGTMTVANWIVPARGTGAGVSIMNMTGGTLNFNGGNEFSANWNTGGSTFVLNIANASLLSANAANLNLMRAAGSANLGEVNLLSGGLLQANGLAPSTATGTSLVNFNGGTLKAFSANATFLTTNLSKAVVYSGGGTINNNGVAITIPIALQAPTGDGVSSAAVTGGGSGYVGAPAVTFSGGGGSGASGYAVINSGTVSSIVITNPGTGYTSAPTITLTGGGGTGGTIGTISTAANTSGGMTFTGAGATTLSAASSYTGGTTISSGTLILGSAGSITSSSGIVINGSGAKLVQTNTGASTPAITLTQGALDGIGTVGAVTVGTGGIVANGNGTTGQLTINGNLTFNSTGAVNLNLAGGVTTTAGIIVVNGLTTSGTAGSLLVNVTPAAPLTIGTAYDLIDFGGTFTGNTTDFVYGGNTVRLTGSFANSGNAITLTMNGDTPKWTGLDSTAWVTGSTGASGNWKLISAGTKTDYIQGDDVRFDDSASTKTVNISSANVSPASTTFNNDTDYTLSSSGSFGIAGSGPLIKSGTGKVTVTTTNTTTGATTINAGTLQLGDGTTNGSLSNSSSITNNGTLAYNSIGSQTYANVISGTGAVTKSGSGTLILSATNSYSGGTTINNGTLQIATTAGAANTGTVNLNGGNFQVNSSVNNFGYAPTINVTADSTFSNMGSGAINYTGALTGANNVLTVNSASAAGRIYINGPVSGITQFNVTAGAMGFDLNVGNQGGAAPVVVSNGASLYFANASNTLFNNITLNGTGQGGVGALFQEGAATPTILGTIALASDSSIGGNNAAGNVTVSSPITGNFALTKAGVNTYTLIASNSYTGTTTINAGTLQLGNGGTTGSLLTSSTISMASVATLAVNRSDAVTEGVDFGIITGTTGILTQAGSGTLTLSGSNAITTLNVKNATGIVDIGAGNLTIKNAGSNTIQSTTGGTINATGGGKIVLSQNSATDGPDIGTANGTTLTINASITGTSAYENWTGTNNGTGVTILTAANDYTGDTIVHGGVLSVANIGNQGSTTSNLGQGTTIHMGVTTVSTGTLLYTGTGETTNRVMDLQGTTAGGIIQQDGSGLLKFTSNFTATGAGAKTLTLTGTGNGEIAGAIVNSTAATSVTKAGAGTWMLTGSNTYSGVTTVNAGVLQFQANAGNTTSGTSRAMSASSQLTVNDGTVQLRADNNTTFTTSNFNPSGGSTTTYDVGAVTSGSNNRTLTLNSTAAPGIGGLGGATMTWNITGSNGDSLAISGGALTFQPGQNSQTLVLNPTTANLSVLSAIGGGGTSTNLLITLDGTSGGNLISGNISGSTPANLSLTKSNSSTWTLSGSNTYTGATNVNAGTLAFDVSETLIGGLTIGTSGTAALTSHTGGAGNVKAIDTSALTLSGSGVLDLNNNALVVRNGDLAAITAAILSGANVNAWNGPGITSSTAGADANHITTLGVSTADAEGLTGGSFAGVSGLSGSDVLVKYTFNGDTNFDGAVTGADFLKTNAGFLNHSTGWENGDTNLDGSVTGADFLLINAAFLQQGGVVLAQGGGASSQAAAVPEPGTVGLMLLGGAGLLAMRQRTRSRKASREI